MNHCSVTEYVQPVCCLVPRGAITLPLDRRGISVSNVEVFLASSNTPLPLEVDSYPLGGNQLHVKGRRLRVPSMSDESLVVHQVAAPDVGEVPELDVGH